MGSILIVDDDADIRFAVGMVLEMEGYATRGAMDGLDALEQLRSRPRPALILLDLMMPRLSGAELMQVLRGDPTLAEIPVVVFSGDTAARDVAAKLGAKHGVSKPVDADQLVAVIQNVLALRAA